MKLVDVTDLDGRRYVIREGRRIEIVTLDPAPPKKTRRKAFEVEFVQFPTHWRKAMREAKSSGVAYELAITILAEAFKREHLGGEIVLSSEVTGMTRASKLRAARELEKLGLIRIKQQGGQAFRATLI